MKRVMSGIKPSNELHLGNLLGCINLFKDFTNDQYEIFLFIPDLHSLTTNKNINLQYVYNIIRYYLAALPNHKIYFYIQSQHKYVCYLQWMLNCITPVSELKRMTQFKDQFKKSININNGFLSYPVLMAADILSLNSNIIPVGEDQIQHIELTRDIARRFNDIYSTELFIIPKAYMLSEKRIYNLINTEIKMSKSYGNENGIIFLNDDKSTIINKIRKATTDSLPMPSSIEELESRHNILNLVHIYSKIKNISKENIIAKYTNQLIIEFKNDLGEALSEYITDIHNKAMKYTDDDIRKILLESFNIIDNIYKQQEEKLNKIIFI